MLLKLQSLEEFYSLRTFLIVCYIVLLLVGFVVFMIKARDQEAIGAKRIKQGYGLFGLTFAMTRIFFLLSDYEIASNGGNVTQLHLVWVTAAYSVTFISLLFIYFSVERHVLGRRPFMTLISLAVFLICLIALVLTIFGVGIDLINNTGPHRIAQYSLYIAGPVLAIGIVILYIIIYKNTTGDIQKKAALSLIGLAIMFAGLLLDMDILSNPAFDPIRYVLSPIFFIAGTLIFFKAQL